LDAIAAGVLLERAESLSALEGLLAAVQSSSEGRLLFVGGEAGVGKTTLLRRFCDTHADAARVLWGACEPLRTPRPLGPLLDVSEVTGGELETVLAQAARPHEVVRALLTELRSRAPTILVIEDVHWADEATLDVLTLLAPRIGSAPALVLASYRDDERERFEQLRFVLGEVVRRRGRLKVEPLSRAAVFELAEPHGVDAEELYRSTEGNPFFVSEVLAAVGEKIPETVRDAVLARAARLSAPARRLLEAVAIVPGQVETWLLGAIAGELGDRLDECLGSGMLRAGERDVAFRHELARLAIEDAVPPDRRVELHRAALAALVARGGDAPDVAALAHHAEAAGDVTAVARWAPRAAERAALLGAHREAAAHYARALRFADRLPLQTRAALLDRRAEECWLTAQFDEAITAQQEALDCHRRLGDRLREGDAMRLLSRLLFFAGRTAEGEPLARQAVELLEPLPPGHELAMAYGNLSQRRMAVGDSNAALTWGARALDLAERLDDTEAFVYALTNIGAAEMQTGADEGRTKVARALTLATEHGLDDYAGRAFASLVLWPARRRRFDLVGSYLRDGLEYCTDRGLDTWRLYLLACRSRVELDVGRWDDAAESAALVLRHPRSAPVARGWALVTMGLVRVRRGDPEAIGPLEEAQALVESTGEPSRVGPVAAARAEAAWLSGDHAAVAQLTEAALALALERGAAWAAGEVVYWRQHVGLSDALPAGAVAEPFSLAIAGEWARAAERWQSLGCPYDAALALLETGEEVAMRQSLEQLRQLGARPAVAIATRRLRERGVRRVPRGPRPQTSEHPAGLTGREVEVLNLLAEGLRNAQIAQQLVLSTKTVDHHVAAILRKLGVHTRGEAVAEAGRLRLLRE
jgi:DNA-binding CsgD family transcriptional regulator/tetratricopeptide (TPR) repeat protein